MEINELNSLSPMRVFDKAIGGGLGKGNLGVLVSRRGVGKTACLVQLATDKLLHGEHVIHVSFNGNVEHVIAWYKEVFSSISKGLSLDDANSIYEQIVRHRFVMNFSQEDVSIKKVLSNLETQIKEGILKADAVLFDGYKLTLASQEDVQAIKKFAEDLQLEVWFSVSPVRSDATIDKYGPQHDRAISLCGGCPDRTQVRRRDRQGGDDLRPCPWQGPAEACRGRP